MTNRTLLLGWWGVSAFFSNWGILYGNMKSRRALVSLPPPRLGSEESPTPLSRPLDTGRPLLQRAGALLVGGLIVLATVAGIVEKSNRAARTESGELSRGGELDVFDLRVGDCFNDTGSGGTVEISEVEAVPCGELHDYEVYRLGRLDGAPGSPFPGEDPVFGQAGLRCVDAFEAFVGTPYVDSVIDMTVLAPTPTSWSRGDREYVCVAFDLRGPVTGSLRGVGR